MQLLSIGNPKAIYIYTDRVDKLNLAENNKNKLHLKTKIFPFWVRSNINIGEIYKAGSRIENRTIAQWSQNKGLQFENGDAVYSPHIWVRRSNLSGIQIRAASVSNPPQQIIKRKLSNGHVELDGVMFEIFHTLHELMNFR